MTEHSININNRISQYVWIIILWLILFFPNTGNVRELHWEEGRRALQAQSMLEEGDWLLPKVCGKRYINKPPMYPWLITLSSHLTGKLDERAVRLPSMLFTLATGLILFSFATKYVSTNSALFSTTVFFLTPFILERGALGEPDAAVMCFSFAAFYIWWKHSSLRHMKLTAWCLCGLLLSLGTMSKGPAIYPFFLPMVIYFKICFPKNYSTLGIVLCLLISICPLILWSAMVYKPEDIHLWTNGIFKLVASSNCNHSLIKHLDFSIEFFISYFPCIVPALCILLNQKWSKDIGINYKFQKALFIHIIVGTIIVFLLADPEARYVLAISPAIALITGMIFEYLCFKKKKVVKLLICILIFAILLRVLFTNISIPYLAKHKLGARYSAERILLALNKNDLYTLHKSPVSPSHAIDGIYNLIYYLNHPITELTPTEFIKQIKHGYVLIPNEILNDIKSTYPSLKVILIKDSQGTIKHKSILLTYISTS